MLYIENIKHSYESFDLKITNVNCSAGKIVGLIGHNGSGKSTLLKIIGGIIKPEQAAVSLEGRHLVDARELRRVISFCPDRPAVYDWMTTQDLISFLVSAGLCNRNSFERFVDMLRVPRLARIGKLSFGNRTKLGLAIGFSRETPVALLDEPLLGLDMQTRQEILGLFHNRKVADEKNVYVVSTHSVEDLTAIADDVLILRRGRVVLKASMTSILNEYFIDDTSNTVAAALRGDHTRPVVMHKPGHLQENVAFRRATPSEVFLSIGGE